jgi:hypothetical protein
VRIAPVSSRSVIGRGLLLMPALPVVISVLAACGGSTDTQSGTRHLAKPDKLPEEAPADRELYDFTAFRSPSSNVGCYFDVNYVRCDIAEANWSPPPRPLDC